MRVLIVLVEIGLTGLWIWIAYQAVEEWWLRRS